MSPAGWKTYRDFILKVEPNQAGGYQVEALGPAGEGKAAFALPFDEKDLKIFFLEIKQARGQVDRSPVPEPAKPTVDFGKKLFEAVFTGTVRDAYIRARAEAEQKGYGLRLRLRLAEAPELGDLPWEYLNDGRDFLALSGNTPLVRYLDLPSPPRPLALRLPFRILVTVSDPHFYPQLNVEKERANIEKALAGMVKDQKVELEFTPDATLRTLQRTLQKALSEGRPFHVWHFIGHGSFDRVSQAGQLVFCDSEKSPSPADGFQLGTLFNPYPEIRLVLLNACEGARNSPRDPFAGVAASLVERGIPAVIGMQFAIKDSAAVLLSEEFYSALVNGLPVDAALTEARRAVFFMPNWVEWATPVLFMRSPDGVLFKIPRRPPGQAEAVRQAVQEAERERLEKEKAERARQAKEKAEAERRAAQKVEAERQARDRAEIERLAARLADLEAEQKRIEKEKAEQARLAKERQEAERRAAREAEQRRVEKEKAEKARLAKEKKEKEEAERRATQSADEKRDSPGTRLSPWSNPDSDLWKRLITKKAEAEEKQPEGGKSANDQSDAEPDPKILKIEQPIKMEFEALPGKDDLYISKTPVYPDQYSTFVKAASYQPTGMWRGDQTLPTLPVSGLSGEDCLAFCDWLSRETDRNFRLPTIMEYEALRSAKDPFSSLFFEDFAWCLDSSETLPRYSLKPFGKPSLVVKKLGGPFSQDLLDPFVRPRNPLLNTATFRLVWDTNPFSNLFRGLRSTKIP